VLSVAQRVAAAQLLPGRAHTGTRLLVPHSPEACIWPRTLPGPLPVVILSMLEDLSTIIGLFHSTNFASCVARAPPDDLKAAMVCSGGAAPGP